MFTMINVLEWFIDMSLTLGSAAATGSIFLLLVGAMGVTRQHLVRHPAVIRLASVVHRPLRPH
jgi:hypothetical protein